MQQLELFTKEQNGEYPSSQLSSIIYYIAYLDAEMLSFCLEDDKTYQDFPKYLFLNKLSKAFEVFEAAGDKVLGVHRGFCAGCIKGCEGYTFLGKQGDYMDILIATNGVEIEDIFECSRFVNAERTNRKLRRVYIDDVPF